MLPWPGGEGRRRSGVEMKRLVAFVVLSLTFLVAMHWALTAAFAHEIYGGGHGRDNQLCCCANNCNPTWYREEGQHKEFLTHEKHWVTIPQDRITFPPIPNEQEYRDA
jgi:hypothetical protein